MVIRQVPARGSFSLTDCLQEGHNIANTMAKALNFEVAEQIIPETNENTIVPIEALLARSRKRKNL